MKFVPYIECIWCAKTQFQASSWFGLTIVWLLLIFSNFLQCLTFIKYGEVEFSEVCFTWVKPSKPDPLWSYILRPYWWILQGFSFDTDCAKISLAKLDLKNTIKHTNDVESQSISYRAYASQAKCHAKLLNSPPSGQNYHLSALHGITHAKGDPVKLRPLDQVQNFTQLYLRWRTEEEDFVYHCWEIWKKGSLQWNKNQSHAQSPHLGTGGWRKEQS
jgi:hypothetical protein